MENNNRDLARFCISKIGVPYVMGTQGKVLTKDLYSWLVKHNPGKWFTLARRIKVKKWIGQEVTDCHGLNMLVLRKFTKILKTIDRLWIICYYHYRYQRYKRLVKHNYLCFLRGDCDIDTIYIQNGVNPYRLNLI